MITETLTFFEELFTTAFVDETSDALRMEIVQKRPFQDDPTRKAPYLILTFDEDKGLIPDPDTPPEIGGPTYWKLHLKVRAAPKVQKDRETAYTLVSVLMMRVMYTLRNSYLQHPVFAGGVYLNNYNWLLITKSVPHVYGGEREWLSYVDVHFYVRLAEPNPYGTYLSEIPE
jgi:hypothetical protein